MWNAPSKREERCKTVTYPEEREIHGGHGRPCGVRGPPPVGPLPPDGTVAPGRAVGVGRGCAGKTGKRCRPHPPLSAGEMFPRCAMGKDANMQTFSGIVPAQGEKLKHKSGEGSRGGGDDSSKGLPAGGSRLPPACSLGRVPEASGWENPGVPGGQGSAPGWTEAAGEEREQRGSRACPVARTHSRALRDKDCGCCR